MSGKTTINVHNYCTLCIEIFKTLNNISPSFVKETFTLIGIWSFKNVVR